MSKTNKSIKFCLIDAKLYFNQAEWCNKYKILFRKVSWHIRFASALHPIEEMIYFDGVKYSNLNDAQFINNFQAHVSREGLWTVFTFGKQPMWWADLFALLWLMSS